MISAQLRPTVFISLGAGESDYHAVAITSTGAAVYDMAPPNYKARLRAILEMLAPAHGKVLMVMDHSATIGALPVAVAQISEPQTTSKMALAAWRNP